MCVCVVDSQSTELLDWQRGLRSWTSKIGQIVHWELPNLRGQSRQDYHWCWTHPLTSSSQFFFFAWSFFFILQYFIIAIFHKMRNKTIIVWRTKQNRIEFSSIQARFFILLFAFRKWISSSIRLSLEMKRLSLQKHDLIDTITSCIVLLVVFWYLETNRDQLRVHFS